jgi:hypothetical protein
MVNRSVTRPVYLSTDPDIIGEYKAPGVTISVAPEEGKLLITAPDDTAADAAEVWLAQLDAPSD